MSRTSHELIAEALLHLDKIDEYAQLDLTQDLVIDAIALRLASVIDALSRLPDEQLTEGIGPDWRAMKAMRNRIAHGYLTVKPDVLTATLQTELPNLRKKLESWPES